MAQILFSVGIADARGSVGGNVFSRNRYGAYLRSRVVPINPQSQRQEAARIIMADLSQRWQNVVTPTQRLEWETHAAAISFPNKVGQSTNLSGMAMYIRSNAAILSAGGVVQDDGPASLTLPGADPLFAVTASETAGLLSIAFDPTLDWNADEGWLSIYMHQPKGASVNFFGGPFRQAGALEGDTAVPLTSPLTLTPPFALVEGQKVICEARIINPDGAVSNRFRCAPFIVAA